MQDFDDVAHIARFMGCTPRTVFLWRAGTVQPSGCAARLLDVLAIVHALSPTLHTALLAPSRLVKAPKRPPQEYKLQLAARKASGTYRDKRRSVHKDYDIDWLRREFDAKHSALFDDPDLSEAEYGRLKRLIGK